MSALLLQLAVCDTFGGCGEPAEPGAPGPGGGPALSEIGGVVLGHPCR
jgi:hypothetical protein